MEGCGQTAWQPECFEYEGVVLPLTEWFPIDAQPLLAFDHDDIMKDALALYTRLSL